MNLFLRPISPLRPLLQIARVALAALLLCGCDRIFDKGSKDDFAEGDQKMKTGDYQGAVASYEAALDGTAKTAEAHYKLGLLYEDKLKSPSDAIHHFDRYLALAPKGAHAKDVQNIRKDAELRLSLGQGQGNFLTQQDAVRLKNDNLTLRKQLVEVRAQKAIVPPAPTKGKSGEVAQKPVPPGARTHVVQPGETLGMIAQKYYKSKARWQDIADANFYSTGGTPKIKPGQTLIIP